MFFDRIEAGILLANKLRKYKNGNGVVLAVPRGGIPVAYIVANDLNFPLDIILSKKIGHPNQKEFAIGAVSLTDRIIDEGKDVPAEYIESERKRIRKNLTELLKKYRGAKRPEELKDKIVIIVDDGIATGNTVLATIKMIRKSNPKKIVVAVPVAPQRSLNKLAEEVDEIICLKNPVSLLGVGEFYKHFEQVSDEEAKQFLERKTSEKISK